MYTPARLRRKKRLKRITRKHYETSRRQAERYNAKVAAKAKHERKLQQVIKARKRSKSRLESS